LPGSMPEMKYFNTSALFMDPVIDPHRGVKDLPYRRAPLDRLTMCGNAASNST
jgi:hypothetical protein